MIILNWTIITAVILVIGFITLLATAKKKKIEVGFASNFITVGLALISQSFGTLSGDFFAFLSGESSSTNILQLITGVLLIGVGIWMSFYIQNKLSILNLLGFKERRIEEHRESLGLNQFEYKEREIDLRYFGTSMNQNRFVEATELIKEKVESFCSENKDVKRGYTGTAPIPLTMYAGACYKGGPTTEFYEYNRSDNTYHKLTSVKKRRYSRKKEYPPLTLKQPLSDFENTSSKEVVLGVSLTMEITEAQVSQFNSPFIHLSIDQPVANVIQYTEQLQEYVDVVFDTIRDISRMPNINKIHLVMSCQSCLPYVLGKQLATESYMQEVIIYHFINGNDPKYPWGISFNHQGTKYIQN